MPWGIVAIDSPAAGAFLIMLPWRKFSPCRCRWSLDPNLDR
jgi:hypothetical protein